MSRSKDIAERTRLFTARRDRLHALFPLHCDTRAARSLCNRINKDYTREFLIYERRICIAQVQPPSRNTRQTIILSVGLRSLYRDLTRSDETYVNS